VTDSSAFPKSRRHLVREAKKAARAKGVRAAPVISRRRQQRQLNQLQLEPWKLLLTVDVGVAVSAGELADMFQDFDFDQAPRYGAPPIRSTDPLSLRFRGF
jgi:hypothetical protein